MSSDQDSPFKVSEPSFKNRPSRKAKSIFSAVETKENRNSEFNGDDLISSTPAKIVQAKAKEKFLTTPMRRVQREKFKYSLKDSPATLRRCT